MLGPLAAQREVGELEQHGLVRGEARGLLEGDQRLADAAQPGLQHLGQLAQRGGGEPLVALRLGHARALARARQASPAMSARLALQRAQLAQRGQIIRLGLQHLGRACAARSRSKARSRAATARRR